MTKISKKSLSESVYDILKQSIVNGDISPKDRLVEERIAKYIGTSRTPVREALKRLEQEDLIEKADYGGYRVKRFSQKEIKEVFEIRSILESYAAVLATRRVKQEALTVLENIIKRSEKALSFKDVEKFITLNTEFHDSLYKASESNRLYKMINELRDHFYRYRRIILLIDGMPEVSLKDHKMMLDAMKNKDEERVNILVKEHILRGMKTVLRHMNKIEGKNLGKQEDKDIDC